MYKGWPFSDWGLSINVPATIQKRLLKFLLKRALGQFLAEELDLDNLEVQLGNGLIQLKELQLNVEVLNDLIANLPVVIVDGRIGGIVAKIPWKNIWNCDCVLEIHNLQITAVPEHVKPRNAKASPEDSHILSSSIHFAGDFLRHEIPPDEDEELRNSISQSVHGSTMFQQDGYDLSGGLEQSETLSQQTPVQGDTGIEGIQILARLIDKLMSNVKIIFKDTCIRLSHHSSVSPNKNLNNVGCSKEYCLDLEIPIISFRDETPGLEDESAQSNTSGSASVTLPPALSETVKSITVSGLSVWIREALSELNPTDNQKIPEENVFESSNRTKDYNIQNDELLPQKLYEAMILSCPEEDNRIRVTLRPDAPPAIQIDLNNPSSSYHYTQEAIQQANSTQSFIVEGSIKSIISVLTPSQMAWIIDLFHPSTVPNSFPAMTSPQINPTISSGVSNIKFQLETPLIELFLLYHDSLPDFDIGRKFFDTRSIEHLNMDHLKFNIHNLACQIERRDPDALSLDKRRNSSSSIGSHSSGFQKSPEADDVLCFAMDIAISQFSVSEWLKNPLTANSKTKLGTLKPESTLPAFDKYTQILYFDPHLLNSYNPEETEFPSFPVNKNIDKNILRKSDKRSSKFSFIGNDSSKEVIKIKLKSGDASTEGITLKSLIFPFYIYSNFVPILSCVNSNFVLILLGSLSNSGVHNANTSNIIVELEPFHMHIDLRIVDRLENYINVLSTSARDTGSFTEAETSATHTFTEQSSSQLIIDDLDTRRMHENASVQKLRLAVNCQLIRLWLHCPDIGNRNTPSIVDNYIIHSNLLIADIININVSTVNALQNESLFSSSFGMQQHNEPVGNIVDPQQNRIKVECNGINVFIKEHQAPDAKCFLAVKAVKMLSAHHRSVTQAITVFPNCEITYRPASAVANKMSYIGNGIRSSPFSQTFTTFEEERTNWPVENEEEEILMFKQRTIESSLFVINCNFPLIRVRLTKSIFDKFQILLNDLSIWQPKNNNSGNNEISSTPPIAHVNVMGGYEAKSHQDKTYGIDSHESEDSEIKRRLEASILGSRMDDTLPLRPSLASLVVFITNVEVIILHETEKKIDHTQSIRSYQLNMSDFRFFMVVKHEGKNDTYVVLDNDQFNFWDTSSREKTQILCQTLNKNVKAKNTRPMISLIALISLDIDVNTKETNLTLSINNVSLGHNKSSLWIEDMLAFLQEPEMEPCLDLPNQYTKLFVTVNDSSIDYNPYDNAGRIIIVFDNLKASSIITDSPMFKAKLIVQNLDLMLVDDVKTLNERRLGSLPLSAKKYWESVGFVKAASLDFAEIILQTNKGEIYPHLYLELTNENLTIETCVDTLQTLISLLTPKAETPERGIGQRIHHVTTNAKDDYNENSYESDYQNMLASLDEEAFKRPQQRPLKPKISGSSSNSNLEFREDFYAIEENDEIPESDIHFVENAIVFDDFSDDFMVDQSLHAVSTSSSQQTVTKDSVIIPQDDEDYSLDLEPLNFIEDHFSVPSASELEEVRQDLPNSLTRIRLRDFNILWKLYDGFDWKQTRNQASEAFAHAKNSTSSSADETRNPMGPELSNPFDHLLFVDSPFKNPDHNGLSQLASEFEYMTDDHSDTSSQASRVDSDNSSVRDGKRSEQKNRSSRPKFSRSKTSKLDIKFDKINLEFDLFPKDNLLASRLLLLIRDLEILDNIKTSAWHKFLSHLRPDNDTNPRENKSNMVKIELKSVRPVPTDPAEEYRLKAKFLPLRFYIDQDALNFVIKFFSYKNPTNDVSHQHSEDETYFQLFEIQPVVMKLDYKPKHIDYSSLKEGNLVELMNIFHLEAAEMTLHGLKLTGVKGVSRLLEDLGAAWLPHITSTQVPNIVSGVAPIRSLVNIGSGVADLILLPIEQYKKDGRIIKGLQRGTQSFAKATTMEAIKYGTKLAVGTQILLEHAEEILSFESQPGTSNDNNSNMYNEEFDSDEEGKKKFISKYANQPADLNEGLEIGFKSLRQNIGTAAHTIFAVPMEVYEKTGTQGTVKAVIRAVPVAVLKPMIGATEAVSKGLLGLRNTIDPNKKLQNEDKYKS
ncbi:11151_t:CDS:10 [Dentiscutata erythropus]|uniref:Autophagy-related protein 2 n=1 Tax=Dentiscutata erythropus TaxID=1348616 RepID=A0A9N9FFQ0_9GLOM|nr:11151_t:CDS:10 [Dentiscutata erythropus]